LEKKKKTALSKTSGKKKSQKNGRVNKSTWDEGSTGQAGGLIGGKKKRIGGRGEEEKSR